MAFISTCLFLVLLQIVGLIGAPNNYSVIEHLLIAGSDVNAIKSWPFQVSISVNERFACSGAILHRKWIITVASCLDGVNVQDIKVRAGSSNINQGGQLRNIQQIIKHEKYSSYNNDIALIELKEALNFNNQIKSIKLSNEPLMNDQQLFMFGWGKNINESKGNLKVLRTQVMDKEKCQEVFKYEEITNSMICTKTSIANTPCWNDFGGPLKNEWNALVGLFSWTRSKCGEYPAVFTDVRYFHKWIRNQIMLNED